MALTKKISDIIKEDTTGLLSKHPSWLRIELCDVATILNGFAFPSSYFNNKGIGLPLIRIRDVIEGHTTTYYSGNYDDLYLVYKNEILVGMDGDFNLGLWKSLPSLLNQRVCKISLKNDNTYDKQFLIYLLPPYLKAINNATSSITVKHLSSQTLNTLLLPLPPLNEQKRIADKIDELFSELDNGIEELETAQKKLELYRQSLLKSAVEGQLSKEWRETQTEVTETGKHLLARILKERREHWEQEKLKEFAEKGKNPPKDWEKKYPEPVQADTANLPKLPEGWVWATLSQVGWLDRGKSQYRPRNAPHLYGGDYPFIQTSDIRYADTFLENYEKTYSEAGLAQSRLWPIGTMCITIAANIGHTAIMSFEGCFPDSLVGFLTTSNDVSVRYIEFFMRTIQQKLEDEAPATAQKNINLDILSKVVLPLPPFKEQVYLVEVLDNQLEKLQRQHDTIKNSIESITKQKLNILKQAFNGKLVTQDTNDESALVLLERIQQQRETEALTKKATPKKRSTPKLKKEVSMSKTILDILKQQTNWISGQDLASAFGLSNNSEIEDIEKFYEELRTLSLNNEISIKPDCENSKEQDLIKLKDNTDAS
ncbi:restriction endonuclease subunit S [Acinetobacter pittii]|uniref:restriction endonuclease subunit S n=1 Tax=Acinetobacter pittii TaxID=48296 RepID=UPI000CE48532|nr:restriction endonuclease subunit S [Acinetobacter pittii]PPC06548.1 restriction endonuclease subunit S [Acinetobacter pittii]WPP58523.1 restriction endonuclease subunit S [Acinetobacter pittii]